MLETRDERRLELSFSTTQLRELCENRNMATAVLGSLAALELEQRLADIEASDSASELFALFPDSMIEQSPTEWAFCLSTGHKLVIGSGHLKTPLTLSGMTDWEKVTKLRIIAVEADDE